MTDREIRLLEPGEYPAADAMFAATLHAPPADDTNWPTRRLLFEHGRPFGAVEGDEVVGLARSLEVSLTVPGGAGVRTGAVTAVGVRADRTRRGVMTEMMHAQLADLADNGITLAALYASEGRIYGRFGYGIATLARTLRIDRIRAAVRPEAPTGGDVELLGLEDAIAALPEIYADLGGSRPGRITRPEAMWGNWYRHYRKSAGVMRLALHRTVDGIGGYVAYRVDNPWPEEGLCRLIVEDAFAATPAAYADLWRFLLSVDLVDRIEVHGRPVDDPLPALLADTRACTTSGIDDAMWLRLVDVEAALRARDYGAGAGAVVVGVEDAVLPANSGQYRVSGDGVSRTDEPAELWMNAEVLAMLYLGGWRVRQLVDAGRIRVTGSDSAVATADRVLGAAEPPWCNTDF